MKLIGTIVIWAGVLVLLALAGWALTLYMGWPLWMVAAIVAGAGGLYLLVRYLRRLVIMLRSRSKLAQQTRAARGEAEATTLTPEKQLTRKWKAAVATLRASNLRRHGNPLYVLPWFMVIGRSGTGKTTALTRARLSSPIQKVSQTSDIEQTANCDWWYFDRAVVLDCAGRYVDVCDADSDRREWELGLDMLGRYRAKEGLDGLVLAISTEQLANYDADTMVEEGRVIRARIEQLIRMFGKRFPVYVLVTKCDGLYGFESWVKGLPEHVLSQAMGYLSDEESGSTPATFMARAFANIGARLDTLRIAQVARDAAASPDLILFPDELARLRPALEAFVEACMADNPYLERPFLRGVFFSSGRQEGGATSVLLGDQVPQVPPHEGANEGLFLHDFFDRILPQDRRISRPARLVNHWRRVTRSTGIAAWWLLVAAAAVAISVSFVGNLKTLAIVRDHVQANGNHPYADLEKNVTALSALGDTLVAVERNDRSWLSQLVSTGTGVDEVQQRLKQRFLHAYRTSIQPARDRDMVSDIQQAAAGGQGMSVLAINVVRTINLLQARRNGADRFKLEAMPMPLPSSHYSEQLNRQLQQLEVAWLAWSSSESDEIGARLTLARAQLVSIINADPQMTWLVNLVPSDGPNGDVRGADFWRGAVPAATPGDSDQKSVSGGARVIAAYTVVGRKAIDDLLAEMRRASADEARFDLQRAAFDRWYHDQRLLQWRTFVGNFMAMPKPFAGEMAWRTAMGTVVGVQSPYFQVIHRLASEFASDDAASLPPDLALARKLSSMLHQTGDLAAGSKLVGPVATWAGAINLAGGSALHQTLAGAPQAGGEAIRNQVAAMTGLSQYLLALSQLGAQSVTGQAKAYELVAAFHQFASDTSDTNPPALLNLLRTLNQVHALMGGADAHTQGIWQLMGGPVDLLMQYVEQQTSCQLQKDWEAKVLWPLQTVSGVDAMNDQLFGEKGSVWAFADGPARPFLVRGAQRYDVVQTEGRSVPFSSRFLAMLNNAVDRRVSMLVSAQRGAAAQQLDQLQAQQQQLQWQQALQKIEADLAAARQKSDTALATGFPLSIKGQPTGVNTGAKTQPFATLLSIQCAAGAQTLNNYNFPTGIHFDWVPNQCSNTTLRIKIGDLVLTRHYPGQLGFAHFLKDFSAGARVFVPDDFPAQKGLLAGLGVTDITVRYNFEGLVSALAAADEISAYERLQRTSGPEKQRILDQQAQQQQLALAQKQAVQTSAMALPATSQIDLAALSMPPVIAQCWTRAEAPVLTQPDVSDMVQRMVNAAVTKAQAAPSPLRPELPGIDVGGRAVR